MLESDLDDASFKQLYLLSTHWGKTHFRYAFQFFFFAGEN